MSAVPQTDTTTRGAQGTLADLCGAFHDRTDWARQVEPVGAEAVPPPYDRLLVHHDHMTTTLREFHGAPVSLRVLRHRHDGDRYSREIVLLAGESKRIVEYGIVRMDFRHIPKDARAEIVNHGTPLGDILIRHDVLRRIEPRWYLRVPADCPIAERLGGRSDGAAYGRIGTIHCNHEPAIELLEVVR